MSLLPSAFSFLRPSPSLPSHLSPFLCALIFSYPFLSLFRLPSSLLLISLSLSSPLPLPFSLPPSPTWTWKGLTSLVPSSGAVVGNWRLLEKEENQFYIGRLKWYVHFKNNHILLSFSYGNFRHFYFLGIRHFIWVFKCVSKVVQNIPFFFFLMTVSQNFNWIIRWINSFLLRLVRVGGI